MDNIRKWIATTLVKLASKIYPRSKEVQNFWYDILFNDAVLGEAIISIDPTKMAKGE